MSADNYIAIIKGKDNKFRGYDCCASMSESIKEIEKHRVLFTADTAENAILAAQKEYTEYGYVFVNLRRKK